VGGSSLGVFLVILAFLAGRMRAGDDPALSAKASASRPAASQKATTGARSKTPAASQAPAASQTSQAQTQQQSSAKSSDPNPPATHSS
jgi:hypothetical protein